ncbi:hypothetical protein LP414_32330 [Polaromonas sp. P1(28)-13]|nr:hypothetical protein LP414_32330 [Polaromonas sp. P1(28)-13]
MFKYKLSMDGVGTMYFCCTSGWVSMATGRMNSDCTVASRSKKMVFFKPKGAGFTGWSVWSFFGLATAACASSETVVVGADIGPNGLSPKDAAVLAALTPERTLATEFAARLL